MFKVPSNRFEQAAWRYFSYRLHTCCPVLFTLEGVDARQVWYTVDWEILENKRARETCEACKEARWEHDWGDV